MQIAPKVGTQFKVGTSSIYVIDVLEQSEYVDQTEITGHDDDGNEVFIKMYTVTREQYIDEMGFDPDE